MRQHLRLVAVIGVLIAAVVLAGVSQAATLPPMQYKSSSAEPALTLGTQHLSPLNSALASPSQLDQCVSKVLGYTQKYYPSTEPITVLKALQLTTTQMRTLAPRVIGLTSYDVLMNLVVLKGSFAIPRNTLRAQYLTMIVSPWPNCVPTKITTDVRDFGLTQ